MKKVIRMLEACGSIHSLKTAEKLVPFGDVPQENVDEVRNMSRWICVAETMTENKEIGDAFSEACFELGKKALLDELDKVMKGE